MAFAGGSKAARFHSWSDDSRRRRRSSGRPLPEPEGPRALARPGATQEMACCSVFATAHCAESSAARPGVTQKTACCSVVTPHVPHAGGVAVRANDAEPSPPRGGAFPSGLLV